MHSNTGACVGRLAPASRLRNRRNVPSGFAATIDLSASATTSSLPS